MNLAVVILAAGKGTRMKSDLPKVLHKLAGRPMVEYVAETATAVGANPVVLVVGHKAEMVMEELGDSYTYVIQAEQKGTAHAVQVTEEALKDFNGNILVMAGDVPLITKETLQNLIDTHQQSGSAATVLTVIQENPFGYGRIIRDGSDNIRIVEEKDANEEEKKVTEVNSGTFCFDKKALFEALDEVEPNNSQGEYYLTDVLEIMAAKGQKVCSCLAKNNQEVAGVNTKEALEELENLFTAQASK